MKSNPMLALFVWILTLGVAPNVFAQDAQLREPRFEALSMTSAVSPTKTYSGLPVALTITIRNDGLEPVMIPSKFALWHSNLLATVVKPDEEEISVTGGFICGTGRKPLPLSELKPSESRSTKLWVSFTFGHVTPYIIEPGYYRIRSGFEVADGVWLYAPAVILEVSEPPEELEEAAKLYEPLLRRVEFCPGQIGDHDRQGQQIQAAETLAREHPDTIYGKYALYLLGRKQERTGMTAKYRNERHREPEHYQTAANHLETLRALGSPENVALEVLQHLAYVYSDLDDLLRLRETSKRLRKNTLPYPISAECELVLRKDAERK